MPEQFAHCVLVKCWAQGFHIQRGFSTMSLGCWPTSSQPKKHLKHVTFCSSIPALWISTTLEWTTTLVDKNHWRSGLSIPLKMSQTWNKSNILGMKLRNVAFFDRTRTRYGNRNNISQLRTCSIRRHDTLGNDSLDHLEHSESQLVECNYRILQTISLKQLETNRNNLKQLDTTWNHLKPFETWTDLKRLETKAFGIQVRFVRFAPIHRYTETCFSAPAHRCLKRLATTWTDLKQI